MSPEPGNEFEAEGVLNPASGRGPDGELYLLPRLVAKGNVSRVGLAKVIIEDGVPTGVEREGIVLAPDEGWERGLNNAGTEDPRTTWVPSPRQAPDDLRGLRPAGPAPGVRPLRGPAQLANAWARASSNTRPSSPWT